MYTHEGQAVLLQHHESYLQDDTLEKGVFQYSLMILRSLQLFMVTGLYAFNIHQAMFLPRPQCVSNVVTGMPTHLNVKGKEKDFTHRFTFIPKTLLGFQPERDPHQFLVHGDELRLMTLFLGQPPCRGAS